MKGITDFFNSLTDQNLQGGKDIQPKELTAHDSDLSERSWFDDGDIWDSQARKEMPWQGIWWQSITFTDGPSLAQLVERVLEAFEMRTRPSMRFYLSTVLKAHMFLLNSQKACFNDVVSQTVSFRNPALQHYYDYGLMKVVEFNDSAGDVIVEIMKLLDKYGDCPSVNDKVKDIESLYSQKDLEMLRKVPLWRHTLNVTGRLTSHIRRGDSLERLLVLALAHDLGKMPHATTLITEPHERASLRVLDEIHGFYGLAYAEEIREAILEHHSESPKTCLGLKLRNADRSVRYYEVDEDSTLEEEWLEMTQIVEDSLVTQPLPAFCREIYPYFMDHKKLELLQYNLQAYDSAHELAADMKRILRLPAYLSSEAFKLGAVILDIAGGTFRTQVKP